MIVLKFCAGVIIWISIVTIFFGFVAGGYFSMLEYNDYEDALAADPALESDQKYFQYVWYGLWGIAVIYVLLIICLFNRIRLGIAIFKCTASFIGSNPLIFLIPVIFLFLILIWIVVWMFFAAYIYSVGDIEPWQSFRFMSNIIWT